jgi:hypothetical protein
MSGYLFRMTVAVMMLLGIHTAAAATCSPPNLTPDGCEIVNGVVNPGCNLTDWHDSYWGSNWFRTDNNFVPGGVCISSDPAQPTNIGGVTFVAGYHCAPDPTHSDPGQPDDQRPAFPCESWVPDSSAAQLFTASASHFNIDIVFGASGQGSCCVRTRDVTSNKSLDRGTWACGYVNAKSVGETWTSHDSGNFWSPQHGLLIKGHVYSAMMYCAGPPGSSVRTQGINLGTEPR